MNTGKIYTDPDNIIAIMWRIQKAQIIEDLKRITQRCPVIICDPIDLTTPSPDVDIETTPEIEEANNGKA